MINYKNINSAQLKRQNLIRLFFKAASGIDIGDTNESTALAKRHKTTKTYGIATLRKVWRMALLGDVDYWPKNRKEFPWARFTLYNPGGKPFRVKCRVTPLIMATPVGILFYAQDIIINHRCKIPNGYVNIKRVRWTKSPFRFPHVWDQHVDQPKDQIT